MNLFKTSLSPNYGNKLWYRWSMAGPLNKPHSFAPSILQFDIREIWRWKCQSRSDESSLWQDHQTSTFKRREEWDEEVSFCGYHCSHSAHCCMLLILFCFFTHIARYIDRNAHDSDGAVCCLTHAACLFTHVPRYLIQISQTEFGNQMRSSALWF